MVPGMIMMWNGSVATIPSGWHLCDGTVGTPDLRNQFVICAEADIGGIAKADIEGVQQQSGGSASHVNTHAAGIEIADSTPVGNYASQGSAAYHYPPCFALCYIMKL